MVDDGLLPMLSCLCDNIHVSIWFLNLNSVVRSLRQYIKQSAHTHTHTQISGIQGKKRETHTTLIGHAGDKLYSKFTNHKLDHVYTPTFFMYLITTISHMVMHLLISWWVVSNNRCLQILFLNLVFILLLQYTHIKNSVLILFCFFSPLCFLFYFFPTGRNGNHNNWI